MGGGAVAQLTGGQPLEREEEVLDSFVTMLGHGQLEPDAWDHLHAAARRDGRIAELAFAYEAVAQGKRLKTMAPAILAELNFHAGRFFSEVFGDDFGATAYLERAVAAAPGSLASSGAFDRLVVLLTKAENWRRLAEVYVESAGHRPRVEQVSLLRLAAELFDRVPGESEKATEIFQQLLRLDPHDEAARSALEGRYLRANRIRDVARLLEQALTTDPPPDPAYEKRLRARLVELYAAQLHEPERTMPHVEALLGLDPTHAEGHRVASKLLIIKGLAARAAAALAQAHERLGNDAEVARLLSLELENTRGPKRRDVLRRLGMLKQDRLNDPGGAYEVFEAALGLDPTDDELRRRYARVATVLRRQLDAARTLSRASAMVKEGAQKTRLNAEMGDLLLSGGDQKKARAVFVSVLASPDADAAATLTAARALSALYAADKDHKAYAEALEKVVASEPDAEARRQANVRLAELYGGTLGEPAKAIAAWQRLLDSSSRAQALMALEPLYESTGARAELAMLLEERAKDAVSPFEARALLVRSAEALTELGETARASEAWGRLVEKYGAARDILARWIPLLETQKAYPELAEALKAEAQLAPEHDRVGVYARLGTVLHTRVGDNVGALDAFRRALALDPNERVARASVEKLLAAGDQRLMAAAILEPLHRGDTSAAGYAGLLRVLEARATLATAVEERIAALEEAMDVAEHAGGELRPVDFAGRGLKEAVDHRLTVAPWLARVLYLSGTTPDPGRRAALLRNALGDLAVDRPELLELAIATGEALASAGDVAGAVDVFRRALAFDPTRVAILERIDELLRQQGNPADRVALYRDALGRERTPAKRRELFHTIATLERRELLDGRAAAATYRTALTEDPSDRDAHDGLTQVLAEAGAWEELCEELGRHAARSEGEEARATRVRLAEIAAVHKVGGSGQRGLDEARALLSDPQLLPVHLETLATVAKTAGDDALARTVVERRAAAAGEVLERAQWLERLGDMEVEAGHAEAGVGRWREGAREAEAAGEEDAARRLFERVLDAAPHDAAAAASLVEIYTRAEAWSSLPRVLRELLKDARDDGRRVELLMTLARIQGDRLDDGAGALESVARAFELVPDDRTVLETFERMSTRKSETEGGLTPRTAAGGNAADAFAEAVGRALVRGPLSVEARGDLAMARARVLGAEAVGRPERKDGAVTALRSILEDPRIDEAKKRDGALALGALLAEDETERHEDRRWLFGWRVEHGAEPERLAALRTWADTEERVMGDGARALALHRRVLELDPEDGTALGAVARLSLATGDVGAAVAALTSRRDRSDGAARNALDLEIASLLVARGGNLDPALTSIRSVLESSPQDAVALQLAGRLLVAPEARGRAVEILEGALEAAEDDDVRASVLTTLLDAPPTSVAEAARREAWHERLLDLHERRERTDLAFEVALRAVEELPGTVRLWDRAEALARARQSPKELADLYQRALDGTLTPEEAASLGRRAVAFFEEWFEEPAGVVRVLRRVFEVDPSASWAFDRLKLLYNAQEQWDDLFALYDRALASSSGASRVELLQEAAQVAKDFASKPDRAIGYLEELHRLRPADGRVASALERLYERRSRPRDLVTLLTSQIAAAAATGSGGSAPQVQRMRIRTANLWLDDLGDAAAALAVVEDMLSHGKGDVGWEREAAGLLERILAKAPATAETRDAAPREGSSPPPKRANLVRQRAAGLLRERYADGPDEGRLARILEIELEAIKNVKERIRRHGQIAEIHRRLGRSAEALEHAVALVLLAPESTEHRARLSELAEVTGRTDRHAEVLAAAADEAGTEELRAELLLQSAHLYADVLHQEGRAIDLLLQVLALPSLAERNPSADETLLTAARKVEPLLLDAGRGRERLDVLERMAKVEPSAGARRPMLLAAGRLASDLDELPRAVAAFEALLTEVPSDVDALDGLVAARERGKEHVELLKALDRRARAPLPEAQRRRDRVTIALVAREALADNTKAIDAWRALEKEFGPSPESTTALRELFAEEKRFPDLAAVLEAAAARTAGWERAGLLDELADLQRGALGQPALALETLGRALEAFPTDETARARLRALLDDEHLRGPAVDLLVGSLTGTGEWRAALDLTEARLTAAEGTSGRVAILLEAAEWAEIHTADLPWSFEATRRAFLLAPDREAVADQLHRLAETTGAWVAYDAALRDAVEALEGGRDRDEARDGGPREGLPPLVVRLRWRRAVVQEDHLDERQGALSLYLRVIVDVPRDPAATQAALRAAARVGRWDAAARIVVDTARATGRLPEALLAKLQDAAEEASAWDGATDALGSVLASMGSPSTPEGEPPRGVVRDLYGRLATWHRDKRGDPDAAEKAFARALELSPEDPKLLQELAQVQRRHRGRPLVESLLRLSQTTGGDLDLLEEAAEVALQSVGDRALARGIFEDLFKLASERWAGGSDDGWGDEPVTSGSPRTAGAVAESALQALVTLLQDEGDFGRTVDLLEQGAALPFETATNRRLRHEAARIAVERLNDSDRAAALYLALFEDDADDQDAVARLVSIYETSHQAYPLLALRRRQVARARSAAQRVPLRRRVATLLLQLDDVERAVATLQENLAEAPRDAETMDALAAILESKGRFHTLRELYATRAQQALDEGDEKAAADDWERAAILAESREGDAAGAMDLHARVVGVTLRVPSLEALARLASAKGDDKAAAGYLESLLPLTAGTQRAAVVAKLADALGRSGRGADARARLEAQVESEPGEGDLWARLAAVYREEGAWERLAQLLSRAAAHAPDKAAKLTRLREAAELFRDKCNDAAAAVPLLEQASDLEPGDQATRLLLAGALAEAQRHDEARGLLRALLDAYGTRRPKERAPVHAALARLELHLGDRARALVELDLATRIDPANTEILLALAELARDDGQLERAERSYRALLVVLRRGDEGGPVARCEVLLELSSIAERQGDGERARELLESALESAGRGAGEATALERALRARGKLDDVLPRYVDVLVATAQDVGVGDNGDLVGAARLRAQAARLLSERDPRRAAELYESVLAAGGADGDTVSALDRLYENLGDDEGQARTLARLLELEDGPRAEGARAARLRLALLEVKRNRIDDACDRVAEALERGAELADAEPVLRKAVDVAPRHERALSLYEDVARRGGHTAVLLDALTRRLATDPVPTGLLREVVTLAETHTQGAGGETSSIATSAETILRETFPRAGVDAGWAAEHLAALLLRRGDAEGALPWLEKAAALAEPVEARTLRLQMARLARESLGDTERAASLYEAQWREDPSDREAWEPLVEVLRQRKDGPRLVEVLGIVVEHVDDLGERSHLRFERVRIMTEDLGQWDGAGAALREIVDEDPGQTEAALLLARILETEGDDTGLSDLLARQLDGARDRGDGPAAASLALRLGRLQEKVDDGSARSTFAAGLEWEPKDRELLRAYLGHLGDPADGAERADVMERLLPLESGERAESLALCLAGIRSETWDEPGAERALELGYRAHPGSTTLRERLETTYRERSAFPALAELVLLHARATAEMADKLARFREAARIFRENLGDGRKAAEALREALRARESTPGSEDELDELLRELVDALVAAGDAEGADAELSKALEGSTGDGTSVIKIAEGRRGALLARRADVRVSRGRHGAAAADAEEAHALGAMDSGTLATLLEGLRDRADDAGDVEGARRLVLRIADLRLAAGDVDTARGLLSDRVRDDGRDRDALRALARLEETAQQWEAAGAAYRRLVVLEEGDDIVVTALRLADACERANRLGDARGGLERARMVAPGDEDLRARLELVYARTGAYRELAEMELADANASKEVGDRFKHLMKAGAILLEHDPNPASAIGPLREAYALRPADLECTLLLADAHGRAGRTAESAEILREAVASHKGRRAKELAPVHQRLAWVARAMGDAATELACLVIALDMDGQNGVVAAELAHVALEQGQLEVAQRALRAVTMLRGPSPLPKSLAYQRLGEIALHQGDPKRGALLLKRALDEDPTLDEVRQLLATIDAS